MKHIVAGISPHLRASALHCLQHRLWPSVAVSWGPVQMLLVSTIMLIYDSAHYARLCSLKSRGICPIMLGKSIRLPIDEWDRQCTHTNLRSTHNNLIQICILHTQKIQRKSRDKLQIRTSKRQIFTIYFNSTLSLHKLSFSSGVLTIECPPKSSIGMYYVDCM